MRFWTGNIHMIIASTQLLHAKLAHLQLLLQPYMSPADVRQLALSQTNLLAGRSPDAVWLRLEALQECLPDLTAQQLGAALLIYPSVLGLNPETIRHKWRIVSQYKDMYMRVSRQQQGQQQQQQQPPPQQRQQEQPQNTAVLNMFQRSAERFALLEYVMMQQQQQAEVIVHSTRGSVSNSSKALSSSSDGDAYSIHVPPMMAVLNSRKHLFERLLQEHYPGFRQWHKQQQQQQAVKQTGQQSG
jgi:hypothetical protein